jgi:DNA-binding phage protein
MKADVTVYDLKDVMTVPDSYSSVVIPKLNIVKSIKTELEQTNLSIRQLANKSGMKHQQILRVLSGENYNIETLMRILNALNLELKIENRKNV